MPIWIDSTLYPDQDAPDELVTLDQRVDFLSRLCSAWDFGLLPSAETVDEIKHEEWREAVDRCNLLTSSAYHLLRKWHQLKPLPYLGQRLAYIADDPNLAFV